VRVIAGELGGRRLRAPAGARTRPTSERVREALFSMLGDIAGTVVLDLFAGSGALGIEALSRGSQSALFVERAAAPLAALRRNLEDLALEPPRAVVFAGDAHAALRAANRRGANYDLVFLDPPYAQAPEITGRLSGELAGLLAPDARVVCEADRRAPPELGLPLELERRYGDTLIRIHRPREQGP
jgi:16S rRNA (guanine966-N2)-methyltransferase